MRARGQGGDVTLCIDFSDLGPDIQWVETLDHALPPGLAERFSDAVANYWPGVRERILTPSYCGIRPKLHGPDAAFADFVVQAESPGFGPGASGFSPTVAQQVAKTPGVDTAWHIQIHDTFVV